MDVPRKHAITPADLISSSVELSALPEVYERVSSKLDDPMSSNAQIGALVALDPALTSQVLRLVNSAFFGLPRKVSDIEHAIRFIGRTELRNILLGNAITGLFTELLGQPDSQRAYWRHSVRSALFARYLARMLGLGPQGQSAFTAGLLHDIGQLVIRLRLPRQALEINALKGAGGLDAAGAERQVLGFDHAEVSALLLENWNLPEVLSEPIRFHHTPERAEQYPEICAIIHLADRLAYLEAPPENLAAPTERLAVLDLAPNGTPLNLPALFDYVDDQLDFVLSVLRIP